MADELKPCPKCGGSKYVESEGAHGRTGLSPCPACVLADLERKAMTHEDVVTPEMMTAGLDWVCAPKTRDDEAAMVANIYAAMRKAAPRPVSPDRPPQVAELVKAIQPFVDLANDWQRSWERSNQAYRDEMGKDMPPYSDAKQVMVTLGDLRRLATALSAQGDGE